MMLIKWCLIRFFLFLCLKHIFKANGFRLYATTFSNAQPATLPVSFLEPCVPGQAGKGKCLSRGGHAYTLLVLWSDAFASQNSSDVFILSYSRHPGYVQVTSHSTRILMFAKWLSACLSSFERK